MNIDRLFKLYEAVEGRPASSVSVERKRKRIESIESEAAEK